MSVAVFINGRNTEKSGVKNILSYVKRPEATSEKFIYGNGLNPKKAYEDIQVIQSLYRKKDVGRRYVHYVISFDHGVTPEQAFEIAKEIAAYPEFSDNYQYLLAVHTNTNNLHAHVILNTVNVHTLGKFSQSRSGLDKFKDYADEVLRKYDLNPIRKFKDMSREDSFTDEALDECLEQIFMENQENINTPISQEKGNRVISIQNPLIKLGYKAEAPKTLENNFDDGYGYDDDFFWDDGTAYMQAEKYNQFEKEVFGCIEKGESLSEEIECEDMYDQYEQFLESEKTEEERIQEAEIQSEIEKRIISFFEGKSCVLPEKVGYDEALEFWMQWRESNNFQDQW